MLQFPRQLCAALAATLFAVPLAWAHQEGNDSNPHPFVQSPDDTLEIVMPGKQTKFPAPSKAFGPIAPAVRQPIGSLSGRIVFMNAGHGWMWQTNFPWRVMRPTGLNEMNEDYGNIDQLNFLATYCFNAGATVVAFRPLGHQTNEVVLDNDSANVSYAGTWSDSVSSPYFGSAGDAVHYRFSSFAATETATATYTPNIPKGGFYPVYTWVRHGTDRGDQLYRIRHTGGESQVRIPHHMVGNGWVYLGEYHFNSGSNLLSGAVVISNLRATAQGNVVITDAIRFGNGMGSINRNGNGVSGYPREDESARYWVQAGIGQGQSSTLYDGGSDTTNDESDSWNTPPRMSAEMNNNSTVSNMFRRVHIGFHSNATTGNTNTATARGSTALIEASNPTPNQARLAKLCVTEVENDLIALASPPLEHAWHSRSAQTTSGGYTELSNNYFDDEMDATIIEVAFHDNWQDGALLRDPKTRAAVGKAGMQAIVRYMNEFDGVPLVFLPEPPANVRAVGSTNGNITLTWTVPVAVGGSGSPTNYVIYRSTNGFGFGNPISVGNTTTYIISNLAPNLDYYFYVAAANAGGESLPSEVVGCRASTTNAAKVLFVNAFDRFDRTTNLRQNTTKQSWDVPGPSGIIERVWPRSVNSFDYVVQHGRTIADCGMAFDSCQNEAISGGQIVLGNYPIAIWACGQETTGSETFSSAEQTKVQTFLNGGGHLFVSGSGVGWDLDRASGPTTADRSFLNNYLHADFGSDTNNDSNIYTVSAVSSGIFSGRSNATFDDGTKGIYWVQDPDILTPFGTGAIPALYYNGTTNPAAIQYDGSAGGGRVVFFGFPFETITSGARQTNYMADILDFFTPAKIVTQPISQTAGQGTTVAFNVTASGHATLAYQWRLNGNNLSGATTSTLTLLNVQSTNAGSYTVVVTNSSGSATSSIATLTVNDSLAIALQPQSQMIGTGSNVTFIVTASGAAPLSYQWRFNGGNISGATTNAYTRNAVQLSDAGSYSVVVTNATGSVTSSDATLTVIVPPSISVQPQSLTVSQGATVDFNVTASGTTPLNYQWRKGGINIAGETGSALALTDVIQSDAGSYSVVVTNLAGSATSSTAVLVVNAPPATHALNLPPRPGNAPTGNEFINIITPLSLTQRENMIYAQVAQGNIPNFLRTLLAVTTNAVISGTNYTVTFYVAPDYLAIGSDEDYFLQPMTPILGQRISDLLNCTMPTRKMVNNIWTAATVKLAPSTIPPSGAMTTVPIFAQHNTTVRNQRNANGQPLGALVGGDKKDVVISRNIYNNLQSGIPKPVVIYGWHQLNGSAIQPLYNGHEETYADYSHGIRLVENSIMVNGQPTTIAQILADPNLNALLSDEGTISVPRYPLNASAPIILTQPHSQSVPAGSNGVFSATAFGDAPLTFTWRRNGAVVPGANNPTLSLENVESTDAGTYTVVVSNAVGSATSIPALLNVRTESGPVLFSDNFDINTSADWDLFEGSGDDVPDYTVDWAFDYRAVRYTFNGVSYLIPPSPNSTGGTTKGVKLTANNNDETGVISGVSLYPKNHSFSNNYVLKCDMWINYPGDVGGVNSSGSTEYASFGINHLGTQANWGATNSASTDGIWFANDGEGGTSRDYRAYAGNLSGVQSELIGTAASRLAESNNAAGIYPTIFPAIRFESVGSPGKNWVAVEVGQTNGVLFWKLDGTIVAQRTNSSSFTAGNIMLGYMDVFTSLASPAEDAFVLFDNVRVEDLGGALSLPLIVFQPEGQISVAGSDATFTVDASGGGSLGYQWRFNGTNIIDATGSSYTRTNIQSSDAGSYSVVVTNGAGSVTSEDAVLGVNTPPSISAHPQNRAVGAGSNVVFAVTAAGTPTLSYQWQFNGENIFGATSITYTRSNAQSVNAGSYSVVISNMAGAVTSSNAVLIVHGPLSILSGPQNLTVNQGADAVFNVAASSTGLGYRWRKGNVFLTDGIKISGAQSSSLTVLNTITNDAGSYSVIVTNAAGGVTSSPAMLMVIAPPLIIKQPLGLSVLPGSNSTFRVTALGTPPLSYRWFFNNTLIAGATTNFFIRTNTQLPDAGSYLLVITNAAGAITSAPAALFVQSNIHFMVQAGGSYNGLFYETTGVRHESGGFINLRISTNGAFSGRVQVEGDAISYSGKFTLSGTTNFTLPRAKLGKPPITFSLQINIANKQVTGFISSTTWVSPFEADKEIFNKTNIATSFAGKYTMLLPGAEPPASSPPGYGYGALVISTNGKVTIKAGLADLMTGQQTVPISQNGLSPLYIRFYPTNQWVVIGSTTNKSINYKGELMGWLLVTNDPGRQISGNLSWIKTAWSNNIYAAGFTNQFALLGSPYVPPTYGTRLVGITNARVILADGQINVPMTNSIFLKTNNSVFVVTNVNDSLKLSFVPSSGQFKGSFLHPYLLVTTNFFGAVLQQQKLGGGAFRGTNQSGKVLMQGY